MKHDLIFHIVDKNSYKSSVKHGEYTPESIEQQGFIHCSTGYQVNDTANRFFSDETGLLLLIIDTNRVDPSIKYEEDHETGEEFPHIYGPLSIHAILDKIEIEANEQGKFNLEFSSK